MASYKLLCKTWFVIHNQSVLQTRFGKYFWKGNIFPIRKESMFPYPLLENTRFKLFLCMLIVFRTSRNISFSDDNHILKFFAEGFWKFTIKSFLNPENLLSSIAQCALLHLYFLFGKFHSDIHNKMEGNNSTALPHEKDFDISKDRFSWIYQVIWRLSTPNWPTISDGSKSISSPVLIIIAISENVMP